MSPGALFSPGYPLSLLSEATGSRGLATRWRQACYMSRSSSGHIDIGHCSRLHSRDGSPRESSSCSRPGLRNSRYSRSSRPDTHRSLGSRNASDPDGRPLLPGSLPGNRSSRLGRDNLRRIDSSRSSGRHDGNDRSEPCRSRDRDRNRGDGRSEEILAVDAGAPDNPPENGTAPYAFVAVAVLSAVAGHAAADPDVDGTASGAAAAAQQAAAGAVVRDALLVARRAAAPACFCPAAVVAGRAAAAAVGAHLVVPSAACRAWPAFPACPGFRPAALASAFQLAAPAVRRQEQRFREAKTELLCR